MRYLDRAFAMTVEFFAIGLVSGTLVTIAMPVFREIAVALMQFRMLDPVRAASAFGSLALLLLIFLNNSIPVALSFAYPALIAKLQWTPPLSTQRRRILLTAFTILTSFLSGFFSVGTPLTVFWLLRGSNELVTLLTSAWLHGPIEIATVLVCVAEPARLAKAITQEQVLSDLRVDLRLMFASFFVLLGSAALEAVLGL